MSRYPDGGMGMLDIGLPCEEDKTLKCEDCPCFQKGKCIVTEEQENE
jgi:hypothetical protein